MTDENGLIMNYTSREMIKAKNLETQETVLQKNFPLSEKSYMTKPTLIQEKQLVLGEAKLDESDSRVLFEKLTLADTLFVLGLASKNDEFFRIDEQGRLISIKIAEPTVFLEDIKKAIKCDCLSAPIKL
jgi:hypothetical protein